MRVVGRDDVVRQSLVEEQLAGHVSPGLAAQLPFLHRPQQVVLLVVCKLVKCRAEPGLSLRVQCVQSSPPRLRQDRQPGVAIAVQHVAGHLVVDHRGHRDRRPVPRLRNDAIAHGGQRPPLGFREEAGRARQRQALVDFWRVASFQDGVLRFASKSYPG